MLEQEFQPREEFSIDEDQFPIDEDLKLYAPDYTPEKFNEDEQRILKQFFTNIDKPIFCIQNLPEEVIGALSSLYSRSKKSMRRTFLDSFIAPIINTDELLLSEEEKASYLETKTRFNRVIDSLDRGDSIDNVSNTQRGRSFYETWYGQFGDDSIAEQVGIHIGVEGCSNIVTDAIKVLNAPHISKSSRYVSFSEKNEKGEYKFVVPGEIKGTPFEERYIEVMNNLFSLYEELQIPYTEYIKRKYPKGEDETEKSFNTSRTARMFDDLRDLLPFSTQTNFGMYTNARTYKLLIDSMIGSQKGEVRWVGQQLYKEISKITPSLLSTVRTKRGALLQTYKTNLSTHAQAIAKRENNDNLVEIESHDDLAKLIQVMPAENQLETVIAQLIYPGSDISYEEIFTKVCEYTEQQKKEFIEILKSIRTKSIDNPNRTSIRMREVPNAFESVKFLFDCKLKGGDCRDIWRHRLVRFEHQPFTTKNGYLLEQDVREFESVDKIRKVIEKADRLYKDLSKENIDAAEYVVPFGFLQRFIMETSLRQLYWITELRSGPQGKPHYREFVIQLANAIIQNYPDLTHLLYIDTQGYSISRREITKKMK